MAAYYNENDLFAAAWLRNLVAEGLITKGEVDARSIEEVTAKDIKGFTQCHWFAGIGTWSYALRCAGWPDNRPVWTGSCPCQPFSAAGKGGGFTDERHLWPAFFHLIEQCRPVTVIGEQVEAAIRHGWLDLVQDDMEGIGYTFGAVSFPAASVGAPHIRQRLYWVADTERGRRHNGRGPSKECHQSNVFDKTPERSCVLAKAEGLCAPGELEDSNIGRRPAGRTAERSREAAAQSGQPSVDSVAMEQPQSEQVGIPGQSRQPRATNSFWSDAIWIPCADGKARPAQPEIFPLAHGAKNRVGILRGAGNSIVAPQAQAFIGAYMETVRNVYSED